MGGFSIRLGQAGQSQDKGQGEGLFETMAQRSLADVWWKRECVPVTVMSFDSNLSGSCSASICSVAWLLSEWFSHICWQGIAWAQIHLWFHVQHLDLSLGITSTGQFPLKLIGMWVWRQQALPFCMWFCKYLGTWKPPGSSFSARGLEIIFLAKKMITQMEELYKYELLKPANVGQED